MFYIFICVSLRFVINYHSGIIRWRRRRWRWWRWWLWTSLEQKRSKATQRWWWWRWQQQRKWQWGFTGSWLWWTKWRRCRPAQEFIQQVLTIMIRQWCCFYLYYEIVIFFFSQRCCLSTGRKIVATVHVLFWNLTPLKCRCHFHYLSRRVDLSWAELLGMFFF